MTSVGPRLRERQFKDPSTATTFFEIESPHACLKGEKAGGDTHYLGPVLISCATGEWCQVSCLTITSANSINDRHLKYSTVPTVSWVSPDPCWIQMIPTEESYNGVDLNMHRFVPLARCNLPDIATRHHLEPVVDQYTHTYHTRLDPQFRNR